MKCGHLERVRVELTIKSPLYIGSGEKLKAKELILDGRRQRMLIPSIPGMTDALLNSWQRGLSDDFIRFMMDARQKRLADFLVDHGIPLDPPPAWVKYAVHTQPDIAGMNTLLAFVKNADGMAYIPGSSIKGALRTALIAARITDADRNDLRRELEQNPKNRRASVVERVLRTLPNSRDRDGRIKNDAVNDLLRALEVSDSVPFPEGALTVCRRHWLSADGEDRPTRSPVFMECVSPGAVTCFYLTIDHSQWPAGEDPLAVIRGALADWDDLCRMAHEQYFEDELADTGVQKGAPITLGGGTGFQRKSLVYRTRNFPEEAAQLAHSTLRVQFQRTYKPPRSAKTAPYMFKAASFGGRLYPMGRCDMAF